MGNPLVGDVCGRLGRNLMADDTDNVNKLDNDIVGLAVIFCWPAIKFKSDI
jgi:hypothetical protein